MSPQPAPTFRIHKRACAACGAEGISVRYPILEDGTEGDPGYCPNCGAPADQLLDVPKLVNPLPGYNGHPITGDDCPCVGCWWRRRNIGPAPAPPPPTVPE